MMLLTQHNKRATHAESPKILYTTKRTIIDPQGAYVTAVTVMTYNPEELYKRNDEGRYERIESFLNTLRPDILLVQELAGRRGGSSAVRSIERLSRATGMSHLVGGVPAVVQAHHELALGILWRPSLSAKPGSLRIHRTQNGRWWHGTAMVTLDIDGKSLTAMVYHGPPGVGRAAEVITEERTREAKQLAGLAKGISTPFVLGGDMNTLGASVDRSGDWYDPEPVTLDEATRKKSGAHAATSRDADQALLSGGLTDVAPLLGVPYASTTTALADAKYAGGRRLDRLYVNRRLRGGVQAYQVERNTVAHSLSDHLPVSIVVNV
jgi:endonuclease/exonuclease/phosphatase family metal-dependent hydrolase